MTSSVPRFSKRFRFRSRIYILPTRYGVAFACLVFAMLLGSMNYGTSLGFALTFLLTGLGFVVLQQCHDNLRGVEIDFAGAEPVFAGDVARFRYRLRIADAAPRYELELTARGVRSEPTDLPAGGNATLSLSVPTERRGWIDAPPCSLETRHPAHLARAWTPTRTTARCLVYPAPAPHAVRMPPALDEQEGLRAVDHGQGDFAGLRNALPGDPPRRLAWKAYARTEELMLKQFGGGEARADLFEFDALAPLDTELRLSQLARACVDAAAADRRFGLRLPGEEVPPGSGRAHLHRCLRALALHPGAAEDHR